MSLTRAACPPAHVSPHDRGWRKGGRGAGASGAAGTPLLRPPCRPRTGSGSSWSSRWQRRHSECHACRSVPPVLLRSPDATHPGTAAARTPCCCPGGSDRLDPDRSIRAAQEEQEARLAALEATARKKEPAGRPELDALSARLDDLEQAVLEAAGASERVSALEAENKRLRQQLDQLHLHMLEMIPAQVSLVGFEQAAGALLVAGRSFTP